MEIQKTARFDTKMSALHKNLLEKAAKLRGFKNLTEYVVTTMVEDATIVIDRYQKTLYSIEDQKKVMEILNTPTELSPLFLAAAERREKKVKQ